MTEITQADRELFLSVNGISATSETASRVNRGLAFTYEVGVIAKTRITAEQAGYDRAIAEVVALVEAQWGHIATPELRDAIRNLKGAHRDQ